MTLRWLEDMPIMIEQLQTAQIIHIYITSVGTGTLNNAFLPREDVLRCAWAGRKATSSMPASSARSLSLTL